jgi:hypothetical protein
MPGDGFEQGGDELASQPVDLARGVLAQRCRGGRQQRQHRLLRYRWWQLGEQKRGQDGTDARQVRIGGIESGHRRE